MSKNISGVVIENGKVTNLTFNFNDKEYSVDKTQDEIKICGILELNLKKRNVVLRVDHYCNLMGFDGMIDTCYGCDHENSYEVPLRDLNNFSKKPVITLDVWKNAKLAQELLQEVPKYCNDIETVFSKI